MLAIFIWWLNFQPWKHMSKIGHIRKTSAQNWAHLSNFGEVSSKVGKRLFCYSNLRLLRLSTKNVCVVSHIVNPHFRKIFKASGTNSNLGVEKDRRVCVGLSISISSSYSSLDFTVSHVIIKARGATRWHGSRLTSNKFIAWEMAVPRGVGRLFLLHDVNDSEDNNGDEVQKHKYLLYRHSVTSFFRRRRHSPLAGNYHNTSSSHFQCRFRDCFPLLLTFSRGMLI